MSATLIALALFGCSDDGTVCQRLDTPAQTYQTSADCNGELDKALATEAALRADAPTVYAQCMPAKTLAALGENSIDLTRVNQQIQLASK